jgi:hypothetical protein
VRARERIARLIVRGRSYQSCGAAGSFARSSLGIARAYGIPDISNKQATVTIQMRIGMTHPFYICLFTSVFLHLSSGFKQPHDGIGSNSPGTPMGQRSRCEAGTKVDKGRCQFD